MAATCSSAVCCSAGIVARSAEAGPARLQVQALPYLPAAQCRISSNFSTSLSGFSPRVLIEQRSRRGNDKPCVCAASKKADEDCVTARHEVLRPFHMRRALKIISGLKNLNAANVAAVVSAAEEGGATHVDIACDPELVALALRETSLPVCVSAVEPELFVAAVEAGATMVEVGNYDPFYPEGRTFGAEEVLEIARRTRALLPTIPLSVTVPHTLPLPEQVRLAEALEAAGVDVIQTEGGTSSAPEHAGVQGLIEKAAPTLAATYAISKAVKIPVMCASGISDVTAPMALAAGAAGVGIGSAVNKLNSRLAMVAAVRATAEAMGIRRSFSHALDQQKLMQSA